MPRTVGIQTVQQAFDAASFLENIARIQPDHGEDGSTTKIRAHNKKRLAPPYKIPL